MLAQALHLLIEHHPVPALLLAGLVLAVLLLTGRKPDARRRAAP